MLAAIRFITGAVVLLLAASAAPVLAQPNPEAVAAVRANCRSDFLAYCSGVRPGGREALACLARNIDRLQPACRQAVSAVEQSLGVR